MQRLMALSLLGALAIAAGCGSSRSKSGDPSRGKGDQGAIAVSLTDEGCPHADLEAPAGAVTFHVTNEAKVRGEFEVIAAGPHLVAEQEGIEPGKTATVHATVAAGTYELVCTTPAKARGKLTVTGAGGGLDPKVAAALQPVTAQYHQYAVQQVRQLVASTDQFVAAVKAGDRAKAESLYASARLPYERIEPIAELFPDLDAAIDSRADDHAGKEADPAFGGWHRLEYALWTNQDLATLGPIADKLAADTSALAVKVDGLTIAPETVANGAAGLIEEAANTKISGEEERYSHVDVATLNANVEGAQEVIDLLTPALNDAPGGPQLLAALQHDFADVTNVIDELKDPSQPSGFVLYDDVKQADHASLQAALSALSEQLANVPGVLGIAVN